MMRLNTRTGFSLPEVIVIIALVLLVGGMSIEAFSSLSKHEALSANTIVLATRLRDARAQTLASVGGAQYGVRIATTTLTFFRGASYDPSSATNDVFQLSSYVRASSSAESFVFERLTGNSSASGTIEMYLASDFGQKKTVTVQSSGLVNIQ